MRAAKARNGPIPANQREEVALEPAVLAVLVAPARNDARGGAPMRIEARQRVCKRRAVFLVNVVAEMRAVQVVRREPEHAPDGFATEDVAAAGSELPDPVLRGVDDIPQALLALPDAQLREPAPPPLRDLTQGPANGGGETSGIRLEHVVDRATAQRLDGALFADGAGEKDERNVGRRLQRNVQRGQTVECGNGEVGQNQVRAEIHQRLAEGRLGFDSVMYAADAAAFELLNGQLGVSRYVLDNQYAQVQWHPILRGRSRHPPAVRSMAADGEENGPPAQVVPMAGRPPWRITIVGRCPAPGAGCSVHGTGPACPAAGAPVTSRTYGVHLRGPTHIRSLTARRDGNISHDGAKETKA
jgi:hypothetical protein